MCWYQRYIWDTYVLIPKIYMCWYHLPLRPLRHSFGTPSNEVNLLQCDDVCCSVLQGHYIYVLAELPVTKQACCTVLQRIAVYCSVVQCFAVTEYVCSFGIIIDETNLLQCVAVCCSDIIDMFFRNSQWRLEYAAVCCHVLLYDAVLQCVAVCCSALQCVAVCCSVLHCVAVFCSVLQCVAVCCSMIQCIAGFCRVLQRVPSCCSVLQYFAVTSCICYFGTSIGKVNPLHCAAVCFSLL